MGVTMADGEANDDLVHVRDFKNEWLLNLGG